VKWRNFFNFWRNSLTDTPTETDLKRWAVSEWIEYQAWLFHHSFLTLHEWHQLRANSLRWKQSPFISVVTPVFNTEPRHLRECIYSVQTQAYSHWEMCLIDDGSDRTETLACLQALVDTDPRLRWQRLPHNQGICHATNHALAMVHGEYVAFLDHDDRLAADALYHVAETLRRFPETDIVYSDRDMLSPEGFRYMHLLKPDWSPETLLSGNYLFHLVVYRRSLLEKLGGVRPTLEGSQDYDLILRATDTQPQVRHIPKVLYHWRQHGQSIALEPNVKEYTFLAGLRALEETLARRSLHGTVSENSTLWRGNYRVQLTPFPSSCYHLENLPTFCNYAQQINHVLTTNPQIEYLVILGPGVQPLTEEAIPELVSWLQIAEVGMVTGKVLDSQDRLLHAGLVQRPQGLPLPVYENFPEETAGYLAVTASIRNVSAPHPACCVLRRSVWQRLEGFDTRYAGSHALLDFALRALTLGFRTVYTPFARFGAQDWPYSEMWLETDVHLFTERWATWLNQGDPYYNSHLTLELADMGLNLHWLAPECE